MRKKAKSAKLGRASQPSAWANLFKALSDPHRLRLLALIAQASPDICVCDLNDDVPLLQPTVSHHLKVLKDAGLVTCQRRATWMYYRLADDAGGMVRQALTSVFARKAAA